jgi:hypothetical protein
MSRGKNLETSKRAASGREKYTLSEELGWDVFIPKAGESIMYRLLIRVASQV